jgi:hypothetical protein
MTLQDLKLNTVESVTAMVERVAKATKPEADSKMAGVIEAVVNCIDNRSGFDADISRALNMVRKAYGLTAPVKPSQQARDLNAAREAEADQAEQIEQTNTLTRSSV